MPRTIPGANLGIGVFLCLRTGTDPTPPAQFFPTHLPSALIDAVSATRPAALAAQPSASARFSRHFGVAWVRPDPWRIPSTPQSPRPASGSADGSSGARAGELPIVTRTPSEEASWVGDIGGHFGPRAVHTRPTPISADEDPRCAPSCRRSSPRRPAFGHGFARWGRDTARWSSSLTSDDGLRRIGSLLDPRRWRGIDTGTRHVSVARKGSHPRVEHVIGARKRSQTERMIVDGRGAFVHNSINRRWTGARVVSLRLSRQIIDTVWGGNGRLVDTGGGRVTEAGERPQTVCQVVVGLCAIERAERSAVDDPRCARGGRRASCRRRTLRVVWARRGESSGRSNGCAGNDVVGHVGSVR